jgi:hypothetical protein
VLCAGALPAAADTNVVIGNGDTVKGSFSAPEETETFRFRAPTLALLSVSVKGLKRKGTSEIPAARLKVLDPSGAEFLSSTIVTTPTSAKLTRGELFSTGEYQVVVTSDNGVAGDYELKLTWKTRTPLVYDTGNLDAGVTNFGFAADAGAVPTFRISFPKGSPARPWLTKFTDFGAYEQTFPQPPAGTKKLTVKGAALPRTADYGAFATDVGGLSGGPYKATITLKLPKPSKRKFDLSAAKVGTFLGARSAVVGSLVTSLGGVVSGSAAPGTPIEGASVSVPAGAVISPTSIFIATGKPIPGAENRSAAGPTILLGPDGTKFRSDVTITIPFDPARLGDAGASSLEVYTRDASGKVTKVTAPLTVDLAAGTVSFPSSHFSAYAVFGPARRAPADLNADGFDDLVVPSPGRASQAGAVDVFLGGPGLTPASSSVSVTNEAADEHFDGVAEGNRFGSAVATGDVNGDGIADLVVGAPRIGGTGAVYVFFGGTGFAGKSASQADAVLSASANDTLFGAVLVVADATGDGQPDVLVGAPTSSSFQNNGGAVYRFPGGAGFTSASPATAGVYTYAAGGAYHRFGYSIAVGDLTGDGTPEVAVGADQWDSFGNGEVYMFLGTSTAPSPAVAGPDSRDFNGDAAEDRFGASVGIGDVNQDGIADLCVGAPYADDPSGPVSNVGYVYAFFGETNLSGQNAADADVKLGPLAPTVAGNDQLGESLVVANVRGNGARELIATTPRFDAGATFDAGHVALVGGGTTFGTSIESIEDPGTTKRGVLLPPADVNGDGFLDTLVAEPDSGTGGRLMVFFGPGLLGPQMEVTGAAGDAVGRTDLPPSGT